MIQNKKTPSGDFTIFGFTRDPGFIQSRLSPQLGITPYSIEIGSVGWFYYYSTYGDIAESEETIVLKLGFLRSTAKSPLTARQLLDQKLAGSRSIKFDNFSGNGTVIALSKTEPVFTVFHTLMAVPEIHYSSSSDGIICSDVLRCILSVMPQIEINETILPQHFLFQSVCGPHTYIQNVDRLMPGHNLKWVDGNVEIKLVRGLDAVVDETQYIRNDVKALNLLAEKLEAVVGDYTEQIEGSGHRLVNQLSGGVDSSLTQFFINTSSTRRPFKSISYVIQVPAFDYEIKYAQEASRLMHTEHTFVNYAPQDYPGLLTRSIDLLAQPPNHETTPSFLAIAEYIRSENWKEKYFFTGHAADSLFGFAEAMKQKGLEMIRKVPFAATWLKGLGIALSPITSHSQTLVKGAEIIASGNNPDALVSRSNSILTYEVDWDIVRRSFGDQTIRDTLAYRRNLTAQYTHSCHYLDKVHLLELVTFTYDLAVKNSQLALAHRIQQVFPFHDEDLIKLALTFHPDMRYIKGFRYKHLLRRLLEQKINAPVAHKSKGVSTVNDDLVYWMRSGPLKPLVDHIQRPSFLSKADFERMIQTSNYFLFALLTFDIFKKQVIESHHREV